MTTEKIDPNLRTGIALLVKEASEDKTHGTYTPQQKIDIYRLGLAAAGIFDKVEGKAKGARFK